MNGPTFAPAPAPPATTALAPVARPRPARPAAKPDLPGGGGAMVLTYLRLHWMMIAFCGAAAGAGLSYTAWTVLPVKYESYAMLQVASNPFMIAGGNDRASGQTAFATYVKTCKSLIRSEKVLDAALTDAKYKIANTETLKAQKDPIRYLDEKLIVEAPEGSEIITVRLEGDRPEDLPGIVNAVKDAFLKKVVEEDVNTKTVLRDLVEKFKLLSEERLKTKVALPPERSRSRFGSPPTAPVPPTGPAATPDPQVVQAQAGGVAPAVAGGGVAVTDSPEYKKMRMATLQGQIDKMEADLPMYPPAVAEWQALVDKLKAEVAADAGPPSAQAVAAAANDPEVQAKEAQAKKLDRDYQNQLATSVNRSAVAHRHNQAAASVAWTEADRLKQVVAARIDKPRAEAKAADLAAKLDNAERGLRVTLEKKRLAEPQLADARQKLAALTLDVKKEDEKAPFADPVRTDIQTQDEVYKMLSHQVLTLGLELKSPLRVTSAQMASTPRQKDPKKQVMAAVVAALAGFGLVGFGAVAYEVRVRKVSSLAELRTAGPTPVVGVVPWEPAAAADPLRRADTAEGVDKLRATVAQEWLGRGPATIVVTSPIGDEGKAFTAFRLATSLAQAGVRTLLVDFDLRTPSLHQFAGVPNSCGVADILRGEANVRAGQIVMPSGLTFLPAGEWARPATGADPVGAYPTLGATLDPLLHELRAEVDCLILHGHALLTAADTVEIARRCDVVLLCAQYRETRLPLMKRAADRVAAMAGPQSGVVYLGASRQEALC